MKLEAKVSKDRATFRPKKYRYISMVYRRIRGTTEARRRPLFCPAARFAVCATQNRPA
jgi:hypothetical protein